MPTILEGLLIFDFPGGWQAEKFDDWTFYREHFSKIPNSKAIDILAIDQNKCCWCIEIKDYCHNPREKTIDLADEVALKVRDTLAALVAAQINANKDEEKKIVEAAVRCQIIRVVLHLEQPAKHSKMFPRAIDPAKVKQRLKQLIKSIDPHPLVVEMNSMSGVAWSVTSRGALAV